MLVIFLFGLGLRLLLVWKIPVLLVSDQLEYQTYARNLVLDHRYHILHQFQVRLAKSEIELYSYRPPGYPLFLALIYFIFGIQPRAGLWVQGLLDSFSILLVYFLARRMVSESYSLLSAFAYSIYVVWPVMIMSETLFIFLFVLSLILLIRASEKPNASLFFLQGLIFGYSILVRPGTIIFFPVFLWYLFRTGWSWKRAWMIWVLVLGLSLPVVPWLVREYRVHHRLIWISTIEGRTFFDGMDLKEIKSTEVIRMARKRGLDEVGLDRLYFKIALTDLVSHPQRYPVLVLRRLGKLFNVFPQFRYWTLWAVYPLLSVSGKPSSLLAFLYHYFWLMSWLVIYGGMFGLFISLPSLRRVKELLLIHIPILLTILLHSLILEGSSRYLAPCYPGFCVGLAILLAFLKTRTIPSQAKQ